MVGTSNESVPVAWPLIFQEMLLVTNECDKGGKSNAPSLDYHRCFAIPRSDGVRSHPVIIGTRPLSRVYITYPTSLVPGIRKHHETLWVADLPTLRGWHWNEITNISVYCLVLLCWSTFSEHVYSEHNAHEKAMIPPVDSSGKLWPCWHGLKVEGSTRWHKFISFPLISTPMVQIMSTNAPLRRDCFYINCQRWNLEFQGITMYYTTCHPCPQKTTTAWHQ